MHAAQHGEDLLVVPASSAAAAGVGSSGMRRPRSIGLPSRREILTLMAGGLVVGCGDRSDAVRDAPGACHPTRADVMGPFFLAGAPMRMMIADAAEPGERLEIVGRLLGSDCMTPLEGVGIEVWQADRGGNYHTAAEQYRLRGQASTLADGMFRVQTIRPGNYRQGSGLRPAHVHFTFAHPAYRTLTTQIYFSDDRYLAPRDSCTSCGSDDAERILVLAGDAASGWTGSLEIVLAGA